MASIFMGELPDVEDMTSEYVAKTKELQSKLELYYETGISNISRNTFRHYVRAVLERDETEVEWRHFLLTFTHDNTRLNNKIYKWIETCIMPLENLEGKMRGT